MNAEHLPSPSRCPRCAGDFRCGINGPGPCACTGVALGASLQAELRLRYSGCLCMNCLQALAAQDAAATPSPQPPGGSSAN